MQLPNTILGVPYSNYSIGSGSPNPILILKARILGALGFSLGFYPLNAKLLTGRFAARFPNLYSQH